MRAFYSSSIGLVVDSELMLIELAWLAELAVVAAVFVLW